MDIVIKFCTLFHRLNFFFFNSRADATVLKHGWAIKRQIKFVGILGVLFLDEFEYGDCYLLKAFLEV